MQHSERRPFTYNVQKNIASADSETLSFLFQRHNTSTTTTTSSSQKIADKINYTHHRSHILPDTTSCVRFTPGSSPNFRRHTTTKSPSTSISNRTSDTMATSLTMSGQQSTEKQGLDKQKKATDKKPSARKYEYPPAGKQQIIHSSHCDESNSLRLRGAQG